MRRKLRSLRVKPNPASDLYSSDIGIIHSMFPTLFRGIGSVSFEYHGVSPDDIIDSGIINFCVGFGTFKEVLDSVRPRKGINYYLSRRRQSPKLSLGFWRFTSSIESIEISDDTLETLFSFRAANPRISSN
jgi:hypothetical protein